MFELPTSVIIEDEEYPIRERGDFRLVLDCFSALQDIELSEEGRIITALILFYDDVLLDDSDSLYEIFNTNEKMKLAVKEMYNFFNCGADDSLVKKTNYRLIDWEKDTQMIAGAVNKVAGVEVRSLDYMHWWTFMGYYGNIGKSTMSTVINIRQKIKTGKKLEKYEREFRNENPQYFVWNSSTISQAEDDAWFDEIQQNFHKE